MSQLTKEILTNFINEFGSLTLIEYWHNDYYHNVRDLLKASIPQTTPIAYHGSFDKEPSTLPLKRYVYGVPEGSGCPYNGTYSTVPNRKWNDYKSLMIFDLDYLRLDNTTVSVQRCDADDISEIIIVVKNYKLSFDRYDVVSTYHIDINWEYDGLLNYILKTIVNRLKDVAKKEYEEYLYKQKLDAINTITANICSRLGIVQPSTEGTR